MVTMQGWVTRNRLREEQEMAKIERARKEGFDDGYLAGKTFAGMEIASLRAKLEAVPVTSLWQKWLYESGEESLYCDADKAAIDRWLAGLEGK